MADNELYSAYHWAKKAERAAASLLTKNEEVRLWLDKLWDDIDAGLLGDTAKTGSFYTTYTKEQ